MPDRPLRRVVVIEHGGGPAAGAATDTVTLDHDRRSRRRIVLTTDGGAAVLLDRARAATLRGGDILRLDDGAGVRVVAAAEPVTDVTAPDLATLVRIAWHLGNRHLPTQLLGAGHEGRLRIRSDHVIEAMAIGLGGRCELREAPFDPEGGAYEGGHHHDAEHDATQRDDRHHHHG